MSKAFYLDNNGLLFACFTNELFCFTNTRISSLFTPQFSSCFQVKFKPSNAYYSWEQHGPLFNGDKILVEMVRNAAINSKLDDKNCAKLVAMVNPMVDQEGATEIQKEYKKQLMKDNAIVVRQDTNYSAEKFPKLAASIEGLY